MRKLRSLLSDARGHEQCGDLESAIQTYRKALELQEKDGGAGDLDLHNRLGDLYLRMGDSNSAIACFQEAVQRQEELHLYTNAIAVCKKILRNAPSCTEAYHRAGQLQAKAGRLAEARDSYIEYANRMEREGALDQALVALREFAESCGDEQIRLALADRYLVADRAAEALEQLQQVYRCRMERGDDVSEIRQRISQMDPEADLAGRAADPKIGAEEPTTEGSRSQSLEPSPSEVAELDSVGVAVQPDVDKLVCDLMEILGDLEEDEAIEAYLALGDLLAKSFTRFTLRSLTTSSSSGAVTTAVEARERLAALPAD